MHRHKLLQKWENFVLKLLYELLDWNVLLKKFEIGKIETFKTYILTLLSSNSQLKCVWFHMEVHKLGSVRNHRWWGGGD